jgi:hypothetical protein
MRLPILASVLFATALGFHQAPGTRFSFSPLIPSIERSFAEQSVAPEFVVFADQFSATALNGWPARKSPQLAAIGSVAICPWSKAVGRHGYAVRVQLDTLAERSAVARYEISCSSGSRGSFATGEVVELELRGGKWVIRRVLDRRVTQSDPRDASST